jgi:hypothetical protein
MLFWVNLPLDPALKAKVDAPNVIGGGVAPKGVAMPASTGALTRTG